MSKFSFNGILIDDLEIRPNFAIPAWTYHDLNFVVIPGRHGALQSNRRLRSRSIPVPVNLKFIDEADLKMKKERIASQLVTNEAKELIFDIEPDRRFFGIVEGPLVFNERELNVAIGTINFICHNPFKHALEEHQIPLAQVPNPVNYIGTVEQPNWRFETTVANATNHVTIIHEESEKQISVNWNFQPGDLIVIDSSVPQVVINGNIQLASLAWSTNEWFELTPGINTIGSNVLSSTFSFTERWF